MYSYVEIPQKVGKNVVDACQCQLKSQNAPALWGRAIGLMEDDADLGRLPVIYKEGLNDIARQSDSRARNLMKEAADLCGTAEENAS